MTRPRKPPPAAARKYLAEIGAEGGKVGGKSKSAKKSAAARANGKKGGRPKKLKTCSRCFRDCDTVSRSGMCAACVVEMVGWKQASERAIAAAMGKTPARAPRKEQP